MADTRKQRERTALTPAEQEHAIVMKGGVDFVLDQVANGSNLRTVARRLGVSYWWLYNWMVISPIRAEALKRARAANAEREVEEAGEIGDQLGAIPLLSPAEVNAARLRMEHRWRKAERMAPDDWGEQKPAAVNVNVGAIGAAHLAAARQINDELVSPAEFQVLESGTSQPDEASKLLAPKQIEDAATDDTPADLAGDATADSV
jgi:hypothetical protein